MLIHNKDDIEFVSESHVFWDTLYEQFFYVDEQRPIGG